MTTLAAYLASQRPCPHPEWEPVAKAGPDAEIEWCPDCGTVRIRRPEDIPSD